MLLRTRYGAGAILFLVLGTFCASAAAVPSGPVFPTPAPTRAGAGVGNTGPPGKVVIRLADLPPRSTTDLTMIAGLEVLDEFFRRHPEYDYESVTGITLPEGLDEARLTMAFAGDQGPDVFGCSIRLVQNYIRLGLLYPLEGLIERQKKSKPGWKTPDVGLPESLWDAARDDTGKVHAMLSDYWILSLWYRKDLFEEAGIVPPRPPSDWNEFFDFAQRLTWPEKRVKSSLFQSGQYGTAIRTSFWAGFIFTNFVLQAGGQMTMQKRVCPDDGTVNEFVAEDKVCACAKCGRSLMDQPRTWELTYGRKPGQRALAFYKKLRWTEWVRCPDCDTPNNLPVAVCPVCKEENPIRQDSFPSSTWERGSTGERGGGVVSSVECRVCGTSIPVTPDQCVFRCKKCGRDLRGVPVFTGVVRVGGDPAGNGDPVQMFARGEIAMMLDHMDPDNIDEVLSVGGLRPDQIGFGPPPEAPGGTRAALMGGTAWCISAQAVRDPRVLQAAWEYLLFQCSEDAKRIYTDFFVKRGYPNLVRPQLLKQFGYDEEYEDYEPSFRKALEDAPKFGRVQPHDPHYQNVEGVELAVPIDTIMFQGGQYKDPAKVIQDSMEKANAKLYRIVPDDVKERRERLARLIFFLGAPMVLGGFLLAVRGNRDLAVTRGAPPSVVGGAGRRRNVLIAWGVMAPALITVTLWQYVPLIRGTAMAFFEYKIYGGGKFIGLQNFIEVLTSPDYWNSVRATVFYVGISLGIGFVAPIALALLLSEVPRGKMLFRTLFYLPAITTGLVIMFLWKMFYAPTPTGLLNRIMMPVLHFFHVLGPDVTFIDWLHTPGLAMLCVVIPGVWAGAGPGSLIYLAALKTVPEDLYESIAIDGGSALDKIRHVMLPAMKPLIMINFIGAFIGAFQAMQNVFVMTGGGPANSTMVLGIQIWSNAFLYLRFGYATAMAWVLGSILIGFTVLQLRILKRVEFRTAHQVE